jgi:ABC-type lipoprotein export system ATPase subunit
LLTSPKLLLMDEPLAALDSQRKSEILPYLQRLHDELDIPGAVRQPSQDEVARNSLTTSYCSAKAKHWPAVRSARRSHAWICLWRWAMTPVS